MHFIPIRLPGPRAGWGMVESGCARACGRYLVECGSCQMFFCAFSYVFMNPETLCGYVFIAFLISMGSYSTPHSAALRCPLINALMFLSCQHIKINLILFIFLWLTGCRSVGLYSSPCRSLLTKLKLLPP